MKLEYCNDWENDIYSIGGKELATLKKVSIIGREFNVKSRNVSVPYNDMGHEYYADSRHYFIKDPFFGNEIDLNTVIEKFEVIALKYTLE